MTTREEKNEKVDVRVSVDGGKYEAILYSPHRWEFRRHGEPWPAADDLRFSGFVTSMILELAEAREKLAKTNPDRPTPDESGVVRKAHYGEGRQPWDSIVELGFGPAFAAANVIKYLRRTKDRDHSLASARWYYDALVRGSAGEINGPWTNALAKLEDELTVDERKLARNVG